MGKIIGLTFAPEPETAPASTPDQAPDKPHRGTRKGEAK